MSGRQHINPDLLRYFRYRQQFYQADRRQMMVVIVGCTLAICGTIRNDFVLLGGTPLLAQSLVFRVGHLIVTAIALALLLRAKSAYHLDWIGSVWTISTSAYLGIMGVATRLPVGEVQGPTIGLGVATTIFYFAQRGRLCGRAWANAIAAIAFVAMIYHPSSGASQAAKTTAPIAILLLNVIGIVSARNFDEQRQMRFDAERRERHARHELAAKNRELARQKEQAEATYKARTAFLAAMSHEFRTPMNAVIGLSDMLVNAPLGAEYREHAKTIRESASSLLVVLNDVLDLAKIDAGKLELTHTPFDLHALLGSITDMMQPTASAKRVAFKTYFAPELPEFLQGDDARLRQVLVNLLSNAIKFTSKGTVSFKVTCEAQEEPWYEITFSVEDTGVGMSPDVIGRLFRPFEQGAGDVGRRYGGTGLGLVISRQIAMAMGSDIHVESQLGQGSLFSFKVRMAETTAPAPASIRTIQGPNDVRQALSILVVDDLPVNRTVARVMLARLGREAEFAEDGASAIEAVAKKDYDVIFMDLQMPGMSGIEATRRIKEQLAGRRVPRLVAMSASVFEEDRAACRDVGMQDFVAKPIDIEKLDHVLSRVSRDMTHSSVDALEISSLDLAPVIKLRELESFGEPGFVAGLCRDFLDDAPKRIVRMREAFQKGAWHDLERDAHSLKSTAASLGAMTASKLCATIEASARKNESGDIESWLEQLAQNLPRVNAAFQREGLV